MKKERIEESSASIERRYRDCSKNFADCIWVVDANTLKVLFVSHSAYELRGFSGGEVIGNYLKEIATEDSYQAALIELTKARREYEMGKDPAPRLEIECYNPHMATMWLEWTAKFVREEGEPLQLVAVSRDISDRKFDEMNKNHLMKMYMEEVAEEQRLRSDIELLEKLLPICSVCRQIRDDNNRWWTIEAYAREITDGSSAKTFCPECAKMNCSGD